METSGKRKYEKSSMKQWSYAELNDRKDRWDATLIAPTRDGKGY
jgi:cellobiose-specific phosphotransferase system component IIB